MVRMTRLKQQHARAAVHKTRRAGCPSRAATDYDVIVAGRHYLEFRKSPFGGAMEARSTNSHSSLVRGWRVLPVGPWNS